MPKKDAFVWKGRSVDPRARKFLRRYHVGAGKEGADEHGYEHLWESAHDDLEPTPVITIGGRDVCIFCGCTAMPIQAGLRRGGKNYDTTGRCCVCTKAMDSVDYGRELEALIRRQSEELDRLKRKEPRPNLKLLARLRCRQITESAGGGCMRLHELADPGSYRRREDIRGAL